MADEISRLADLRDKGAINAAEFQQAKAKVLSLLCPTLKLRSNS